MKILITGSKGFIAKNLIIRLGEIGYDNLVFTDRNSTVEEIHSSMVDVDFVFHLAGVNRPRDENEFIDGNVDLTQRIIDLLVASGRKVPLVLSSSTQVGLDNQYGRSKEAAEKLVLSYMESHNVPVYVFRLPNVFGKWSKPNYNSAIATFCYNTVHDLPITIHDPEATLNLVYIDDVCDAFIELLKSHQAGGYINLPITYSTTVGAVAELLKTFKSSRETLIVENVGVGLTRALYSTYLSYFTPSHFSYTVPGHEDPRGTFVEMLKTPSAGQMSFFTAHPGVTRGGHYHHSKNEKFLVIKGRAEYRFRHVVTGEKFELISDDSEYRIVETIPGWTHDITNIGNDELVVMLWANEIFDRNKPDTIAGALT
jgi:UDP-2-acetamido-2,6-beta-L-arabino-hexul-4-ose reductase